MGNFASRLKDLMTYDDISVASLAERSGLPSSAIEAWLNGTVPAFEAFIRVANALHIDLDYLTARSSMEEEVEPAPLPNFYRQIRSVMQIAHKKWKDLKELAPHSERRRWAKGGYPDLVTLIKLADVLDCSLDLLVGRRFF